MFAALVEELVDLTDAELDEFIRTTELERRATEAKLAAAVAVAEGRSLHEADGHRSMAAYLRATINPSPGDNARLRNAAHTIDAHPDIGDAWLAGHLGSAQVTELSKTRAHPAGRERFSEFVPTFVEHGEQLPFVDFQTVLRRFITLADADGTLDERTAVEARSATVTTVGGELHLRASGGDALTSSEFEEIMKRFEQAEFAKDVAAREAALAAGETPEPYRTGPQRRHDALIAMARSAAAHAGDVIGATPLVSVLCDQQTFSWILAHSGLGATSDLTGNPIDPFTGLPLGPGALDDLLGEPGSLLERRIETSSGTPLRPADVLRALLSGEIRRVVLGANSRVIDMGRSSRVFTGAARDAATLLTTTCEHPGCDMPADWCQVDHSTEWHQYGNTDQANAAIECGPHNRDKHTTRRTTRRATDGRLFTHRPDGTIILPVGCRPPRFAADDDDPPLPEPTDPRRRRARPSGRAEPPPPVDDLTRIIQQLHTLDPAS